MQKKIAIEQKLKWYAETKPDCIALKHIDSSGEETASITYQELYYSAQVLANKLLARDQEQASTEVMILIQPGISFSIAYLACLLSGTAAVPVKAPDFMSIKKTGPFIQYVIDHCKTKTIILDDETLALLKTETQLINAFEHCAIFNIDQCIKMKETHINDADFPEFDINRINYLQYTSGSTSNAKAVLVRNKQLISSLEQTAKSWDYSEQSITVTWAPHSHVYGLVCGLLLPLYTGSMAVIISTNDIAIDPELWLQALSHYKATHSGCPNFGYDLCYTRLKNEDLSQYDLSHWQYAVNGGEAAQLQTMHRFFNMVKDLGFKLDNFCPAYGMSEMAGLISYQEQKQALSYLCVDRAALLKNKIVERTPEDTLATTIVSCGSAIDGLDILIFDHIRSLTITSGEVGEILLHSPTHCNEYLNIPPEQNDSLLTLEGKSYCRTGDLGFIHQEKLFLTGRLKELIIINGKNYPPGDIEECIKKSEPEIINNSNVAFSIGSNSKTELYLCQEIENIQSITAHNQLKHRIKATIYDQFQLNVVEIIFVDKDSIPRTASGKIQRRRTAEMFQHGQLKQITNKTI
jgi:acyl-CoA synthetase (AMP-forming)/AMP-acid ligase II